MKKIWLLCVALIWPHIGTATEAPFLPLPNVPDYVATIFVKLSHGATFQEVRTHHGGWTRVDGSFDQKAYRSTSYFGPGGLFITFAREPSAQIEGYDWLHIMRGPATNHLVRWGDNPFNTGNPQTFLGESCEIWNLSKTLVRPDARRLSCVTLDGIELWSRLENDVLPGTSFETTAIVRRQVGPGEVRPPNDRLDLKYWVTMPSGVATPSDAPGDVTVILQSRIKKGADQQVQTRTVRRHYPWTYIEDVDGKGGRRLRFKNEAERLDIVFRYDAAGEPMQLSIKKALRAFDDPKLPDSGRTETILGELCVVSARKYREGYSSRCQTADGVMLKDAGSGQGERYDLVAVRIDRGPVNLDAVLPPPGIFTRAAWSIPD